jgi:hypothetical protein
MRKHHKITLTLLAVLSAVPFFVQADRAEPEPRSVVEPSLPEPVEAPISLLAALPAREVMPDLRVDPFSPEREAQRLRARRVMAPAPIAAAVTPPNPYRFAGEVRQPGAVRRFLVRGNDIFEVSSGDLLSDGYRVDAVTATEVVLVHIATGVRQTLGADRSPSSGPPRTT